ncbi:MAG: nuclear transport factor 2 family protein [Gemmatimonadota bacterium]
MRTAIRVLVVFLVLGFFAYKYWPPTAPPEMTEAEIAQVEADAATVGDQWLAAVNGINADAFLDLFDSANTYAVDGAYYATYDEWVGRIQRLFSTWENVDWAWGETRVDVIAPDAAMFVGQTEGTRTRTDGQTSNARVGVTLLVRKIGGVWKIVYQGSAGRWTPTEEG